MALCGSQQRNLMWYMFGILFIVLGICSNNIARTAVAAYMYGINKVDVCPQNQTEWQKASRILNCSDDSKNPLNRYHCLPVNDLSTLVEFCYNQTRPRVVKGLCMLYVQEKNILNGYNCTTFDDGCPDMFYQSDETYKFQRCMEIDPYDRCYVADSSCRLDKTTSTGKTIAIKTDGTDRNIIIIVGPVLGVICFALVVIIIVIIIWRKDNCLQCKDVCVKGNNREDAGMPLSILDEAEIKRLGFDYLLRELPTDQNSILEIADICLRENQQLYLSNDISYEKENSSDSSSGLFLHRYEEDSIPYVAEEYVILVDTSNDRSEVKVPPEIVSWSTDNRHQFVRSMKKGTIPVYSGRGMVIGCAEAGKTTLVKKLKGEKNITTTSTKGIEIHVHEFKLDDKECTIISCMENEKNKGCLCITPAAGDNTTEVNIENYEQSEAEIVETIPKTINQTPPQGYERTMNIEENTSSASVEKSVFSPIPKDITFNADTLTNNRRNSVDVHNSDENKFWQQRDFSNCVASANEGNLKVLSLMDFAGQSAYYACHHIFFSPRAFYILVVDMSIDLNSQADKACDQEGLIYSDWTYADYISYWLGSIHTYSSTSAPVIFVATHSEGIGADSDNRVLLQYFFEICRFLPKRLRNHLDKTRVFSVEKRSDKNMKNLKNCIASTMTGMSNWGENVPVAWTKLESVLRKMRQSIKVCHFSNLLENVTTSEDVHINTKEELLTALKFFHETGVIFFRTEIEKVIILDVQWFVDAFKCIILDERHYESKEVGNLTHFDSLNKYGLLSGEILHDLWKTNDFQQYKEELVNHMIDLNMLANVEANLWYVPCMNKQTYNPRVLDDCTVSSTLCFVFKFLPIVIFHRLVIACMKKMKMTLWQHEDNYCIYHTVVVLNWENVNHQVLFGIRDKKVNMNEEYPYSIEIQAAVIQPRLLDSHLCSVLRENISKILENLTKTFPVNEEAYLEGYRCVREPYNSLPGGNIVLKKAMSKDVNCTKCVQKHVVKVQSILGFWKPIENGQSSGACGGIESDSGFYQRDSGIKNEDSRLVRESLFMPKQKGMSSNKSNKDTTQVARLARAIRGPCVDVLREVLAKQISPTDLERKVKAYILENRKPTISEKQKQLVYGKDYYFFDITLLYFLLRNMCSIPPHINKWGNVPKPTDKSVSANIERIRLLRDEWNGHATNFPSSDSDFEQRWNYISQIVKELEGYVGTATKYQDILIELKTSMDSEIIKLTLKDLCEI